MAKHISKQLAEHIDRCCGVWETGGVAQFIDDDGFLQSFNNKHEFAYSIASAIDRCGEPDDDNDYKDSAENAIETNIHSLRKVLEAVKSFQKAVEA